MVIHCGQSFLAPYTASKAALAALTRNLAQAHRRDRIRFNGIACGWMDTPGEDATQRRWHGAGDDWLAKAEAAQPFGQLVKPEEVAGLAAYLLAPKSGVMTGAVIDYDQNVAGAIPQWQRPIRNEGRMTVRFGLLGAGRIGKVHARAITGNPDARLVAVADAMAPAAEALAARVRRRGAHGRGDRGGRRHRRRGDLHADRHPRRPDRAFRRGPARRSSARSRSTSTSRASRPASRWSRRPAPG